MTTLNVPGARFASSAMLDFKAVLTAELQPVADRATGILIRSADPTGKIPPIRQGQTLSDIGNLIQRFFVGSDFRQAYGADGVAPLAAYPRLLNLALAEVQARVVVSHSKFMRRNLPDDLIRWLTARLSREQFESNPLATYEPSHSWVDPRGYRLSDRIWQTSIVTRTKVDGLLLEGMRTGRSSLDMAKSLERFILPTRAVFRTSKPYGADASFDAMRLARTEITRAHSMASLAAGLGNPFVDGWDFALSARHPRFDICDKLATISMTGKRIRDPYPITSPVPIPVRDTHPQCVLGDTRISYVGVIAGATQSLYEGRVIEILTRSGKTLTCTLNHPILTVCGWVAAQCLNEGDEVMITAHRHGEATSVEPDNDDVPATIEQIYHALLETGGMTTRSVPAAAEDFHGDGRFMDGNVHIVDTQRFLLSDSETPISESISQEIFNGRDITRLSLLGQRCFDLLFEGFGFTPYSPTRRRRHSESAFNRHPAERQFLAKTPLTNRNTQGPKFPGQFRAADALRIRDRFQALSALITLDEIIQVRNYDFVGHVYNLQIEPMNWYIANSIITHNCLCTGRPAVSESIDDTVGRLRADLDAGQAAPLTPIDSYNFLRLMMGAYLTNLVWNEIGVLAQ